jgi:hypothetical protein
MEVQSSKLLPVLVSTVVFVFGTRRKPRQYFCSFKTLTCFKWYLSFTERSVLIITRLSSTTEEWICWLLLLSTQSISLWPDSNSSAHSLSEWVAAKLLMVFTSTVILGSRPTALITTFYSLTNLWRQRWNICKLCGTHGIISGRRSCRHLGDSHRGTRLRSG